MDESRIEERRECTSERERESEASGGGRGGGGGKQGQEDMCSSTCAWTWGTAGPLIWVANGSIAAS